MIPNPAVLVNASLIIYVYEYIPQHVDRAPSWSTREGGDFAARGKLRGMTLYIQH